MKLVQHVRVDLHHNAIWGVELREDSGGKPFIAYFLGFRNNPSYSLTVHDYRIKLLRYVRHVLTRTKLKRLWLTAKVLDGLALMELDNEIDSQEFQKAVPFEPVRRTVITLRDSTLDSEYLFTCTGYYPLEVRSLPTNLSEIDHSVWSFWLFDPIVTVASRVSTLGFRVIALTSPKQGIHFEWTLSDYPRELHMTDRMIS